MLHQPDRPLIGVHPDKNQFVSAEPINLSDVQAETYRTTDDRHSDFMIGI